LRFEGQARFNISSLQYVAVKDNATMVGNGSGTVFDGLQNTVAVIIPVYNGEKFIRRALDSVLKQTHPPAEIFVVDDGSRDSTREILAAEYGETVVVIAQQNGGPAKARNAGLREARSEFVAFLDADDWWEPAKLEMQLEALRRNPTALVNYTGIRLVREVDGHTADELPVPPESLWPTLRWCNPGIPPSCVMVRRDVIEKVGGFNERQVGCEDWCLWFEIRANGPFCVCPEPLTDYRVSPGGLSGNGDHMFKDSMKMLDDVLLRGLAGFQRKIWRRRIISYQAYKAVLTSRAAGNTAEERQYMKMSLLTWPSPFWAPERFKAFAATLLQSR
jgi:glycosyltransferase involved in cell wall biosynthesis